MEYSEINQKQKSQGSCCSPTLKSFIGVLAFSFFTKSLTGSYTKSTITQIERRFDISTSTVGVIDGSFEMGNLLVITVVSYFGAKFHRPKIIGAGALLMAAGTLLMALPHFLMGRYEYKTVATHTNDADHFTVSSLCSPVTQNPFQQPVSGCQKGEEEGSPMWVILLVGNIIRGIGEATLVPLGISFIDDYARPENSAFYIGCLHTVGVIGPLFGYSLGSLCASLYVDIGLVNADSVSITHQDSRWVGAWWLGYVVAGSLTLLAALPFWFLPRALPETPQTPEVEQPSNQHQHTPSVKEIAKGFGPSLKRLLSNKIYLLYIISNLLMFNGFIILITYIPKYLEQQFGKSTSKTNFLIGVTSMPSVALGIFLSGVIMKKFKLGLLGAARVAFFTSVAGFLFTLPCFALSCQNINVAGVTATYQRSMEVQTRGSLSSCNAGCGCPDSQWDPVCGENAITYISPCHAGCNATHGTGRNMTFHDCACIRSWGLSAKNSSAALGQCSRESSCSKMFYIFLALQSVSFFVYCLGSTPLFIISLRSVEPELKSLSVGMLLLILRVLGGIPAPIYFGAIIDSTCLKWGYKKCGGRGACRMYDIQTLRFLFLGLISCLRVFGYALFWIVVTYIKRNEETDQKGVENIELQKPVLCDPETEEALKNNEEVQKTLKEFA
ncbi:solute carrier organic anion transporter family member 1C1-like [Triplophysa rosa]|uniref:Solute carrier organic anion transporter family member n=1 Tax=Triplophysa rosa TaxID=992332 RepID=A0A9W7T305_TRIRA|nr:solute carrier organic anion transporter family member 1C1-like [Triplophysa rosa]KAI7789635.1 putative solute carrier organic anion transporter family member 1C1-like [Triplophysa rosa]